MKWIHCFGTIFHCEIFIRRKDIKIFLKLQVFLSEIYFKFENAI